MYSLRDLRKTYGTLVAVGGISLEVEPGETIGLLGPNGAGKSTTIGMMCGLLVPDAGSVSLLCEGREVAPVSAEARRLVGIAPQAIALYDELTAEENLRFFGKIYGMSGRELDEAIGRALEFAQLADRRKGRVNTFSGGMKRRLNLATALLHAPRVLLLDEPTAGVDPQSRNLLFESIEALEADGVTIVYTTHYMEEAERLCDRVAIIDHGKLLDIDTVHGLIARHSDGSAVEAVLAEAPAAGCPGEVIDGRWRMTTDDPAAAIAAFHAAGGRAASLDIGSATLEDVFLQLTGRSLRDE